MKNFHTKQTKETKKYWFLILCFLLLNSARAGTNAAVPFNTNTYQVPITNWWRSNAPAIDDALTNGGYTLGGGSTPGAITNNNASQVNLLGGVSNNFATGGNGIFWTNPATGAWGQIPTNSHLHITDEHGTTYDFHTNGTLDILNTNGDRFLVTNGTLTISGTNTNSLTYSAGALTVTGSGNTATLTLAGANQGGRSFGIESTPAGLEIAGDLFLNSGSDTFEGNLEVNGQLTAQGNGVVTNGQSSVVLTGQFTGSGTIIDPRPVLDQGLKLATPSANVPIVIYTNNGQGTLVEISIQWDGGGTNLPGPTLNIVADNGVHSSSTVSVEPFFGLLGGGFHMDGSKMGITMDGAITSSNPQIGGYRSVYINYWTNCQVTFTTPLSGVQVWYDVPSRIGAPITNTYWHAAEYQTTISASGVYSPWSVSGHRGFVESTSFFVGTAGTISWEESVPTWILDGTNFILGNGFENTFHEAFYASSGAHTSTGETPYGWFWWFQSESFLSDLSTMGFTHGASATVFLPSFSWTNSATFNFTNYLSGNTISNDLLFTSQTPYP